MAKINQNPQPMWPWGGPGVVREKLVEPSQLEGRKRKADPRAPALASQALLDFIGPAHSAEELRLPLPPFPAGHDADLESFLDRPHLLSVAERGEMATQSALERGLLRIQASPERMERLKALLDRESEMLELVNTVGQQMREILRLMWDAQKDENY